MEFRSRLVDIEDMDVTQILSQAKWIDPEDKIKRKIRKEASYLVRDFDLDKTDGAILYITAHGIYDVFINDMHVDGYYMAPGSSQYNKRLRVQAYDVEDLLQVGENRICVVLADGWYRGCCHNDMPDFQFGKDVALLCAVYIESECVLASDEEWNAYNGPLGMNDFMKGESYDATKELFNRHPVIIQNYDRSVLISNYGPALVPHETFFAKLLNTPNGETVLDFGQNLSGIVEFRIEAKEGQQIRLKHGETLDKDGNFTQTNYLNERKPFAVQEIIYTCTEGLNIYHPTSCIFGFRYVKVDCDIPITGDEFSAVAIYSDIHQKTYFECGDERVNQLFRNAIWSMKSNFVDVPTDCPTRERSGYSGDLVTFCDTAVYLMDCEGVIERWIDEQASTQMKDGCVKQIAPFGGRKTLFDGGVGWSDSIVIVPYKLFQKSGDTKLIERNYEVMKKFMAYRIKNASRKPRKENRDIPGRG